MKNLKPHRRLAGAAAGLILIGLTAAAAEWTAAPAESELAIEVWKTGALERFAHDHRFVPSSWTSTVAFDPSHPESTAFHITLRADSLHDRAPGLGADDRSEVERITRGPEVLDAASYPEIAVEATTLSASGTESTRELTMHGKVSLHGRERSIEFPMRVTMAEGRATAEGTFQVRQSDFGITPYRKFLGAVGVKDEVRVSFRVVATPR